jgi:hypothetical protein
MEELDQQALEQYYQLPKDIQDAMISDDSASAVYQTAEREGILDKVSLLAEITGDVMRGALPITQFKTTLQKDLRVDEEKARRIAEQIRDKIFLKIAQSLRKIHGLG